MEGVEQLQRVDEKLRQLIQKYQLAQKEVNRLQKENTRLSGDLQLRSQQANDLQQKVDTLKLNTNGLDTEAKKDFEKRINIYLKEIDNCLALLNS